MKKKPQSTPWYAIVLAIIAITVLLLVGVSVGARWQSMHERALKCCSAFNTSDPVYFDSDFGIELVLDSADRQIKRGGNILSSTNAPGFIKRFDIPADKNIEMALFELAVEANPLLLFHGWDAFNENCSFTYHPWIPDGYNNYAEYGQMAIMIHAKDQFTAQRALIAQAPNLDAGYEAREKLMSDITNNCSQYAVGPGGYFLYAPYDAPSRLYFVDTTFVGGGDPKFYERIRILPD